MTSLKAVAAVALLAVVPLVLHSDFILTMFVFTFILGMLAVSFNLIFGFTGQLSMFHAAAFGLSAYITHIAMTSLAVSFWTGLLIAAAAMFVISAVIGTICFRYKLKEFYFAVVTLAFAEMARLLVLNWNSVTNGSLGIAVVEKPTLWLPGRGVVAVAGTTMWYYLGLVALVIVVTVCSRIVKSWMGRCFEAIRLNDELASTLGINVFRYKLLSFTVGNVIASVAGAFYAFYIGYIEPDYLSIAQSLAIVSMVLLGGRESIVGPVIGAFILTALPHAIRLSSEVRLLVYGLILILVILLMPRGILGTFMRRRPSSRASQASTSTTSAAAVEGT
jgi:branched-chain amino acid transport system permease protein